MSPPAPSPFSGWTYTSPWLEKWISHLNQIPNQGHIWETDFIIMPTCQECELALLLDWPKHSQGAVCDFEDAPGRKLQPFFCKVSFGKFTAWNPRLWNRVRVIILQWLGRQARQGHLPLQPPYEISMKFGWFLNLQTFTSPTSYVPASSPVY